MVHRALPHPERSSLRKMSAKTVISSQIQMTNRKNQSIDQNTCPVPNSATVTMASTSNILSAHRCFRIRFTDPTWLLAQAGPPHMGSRLFDSAALAPCAPHPQRIVPPAHGHRQVGSRPVFRLGTHPEGM